MDDIFIEGLSKREQFFWKKALKVNPKKGLNTPLVHLSTSLYGQNNLTTKTTKSLFAQILEHFKELITILLCTAAVLSFVLGVMAVIQHPEDKMGFISLFLECLIICGLIFTNIFLSIKQSDKTDKALQALKDLAVPMARVIRNGKIRLIPSASIVPGDFLALEAGEAVAADAKLIEAVNLKVNESILTGESMEVNKDASYISNNNQPIGDRKD